MNETWKHNHATVNGIRMHYVTQGEGKLLLLLHGFPDFWYLWRHQIPILGKHFQVVAPDLRGYNETEKPRSIEQYRLSIIATDIVDLIRVLGKEEAIIVGHDWGGVTAWFLAAIHPQTCEKLVILNAPHPNAYTSKAKHSLRQLQKSWYVFFFQTPNIPEEVLSRENFSFLKKMLLESFSKKDVLTDEDLRAYERAWAIPGAMRAALNYYRANLNPSILFAEEARPFPKVKSPTLVIWGEKDVALSKDLIIDTEKFVDAPCIKKYLPNCGHWALLERPKLVSKMIGDFAMQTRAR